MSSSGGGCLRVGGLGCLGIFVVVILFTGITALFAYVKRDSGEPVDETFSPALETLTSADASAMTATGEPLPGRVILELEESDIVIEPGVAGEPLRVEASFDDGLYELTQDLTTTADSSWTYHVRFRRSAPGMFTSFSHLMGREQPNVRVFLPPDLRLDLELHLRRGGVEVELGGLWITSADLHLEQGGIILSVDEPLREPMDRLTLRGRMGGFEVMRLGNASPRELDVTCSFGGAELDLRGDWRTDSDIRVDVKMGGADIRVPDDVEVRGLPGEGRSIRRGDDEVAARVLRFQVKSSMGGVNVDR